MSALALAPRRAAHALIRFYQLTLSSLIGRQCRYLPTCSAYADEAIARHGLWAGAWMGAARICRCHPWGGAGFDPPPGTFRPAPPGRGRGATAAGVSAATEAPCHRGRRPIWTVGIPTEPREISEHGRAEPRSYRVRAPHRRRAIPHRRSPLLRRDLRPSAGGRGPRLRGRRRDLRRRRRRGRARDSGGHGDRARRRGGGRTALRRSGGARLRGARRNLSFRDRRRESRRAR